jgi:hypothetical protein
MNTQARPTGADLDAWPALPLEAWRDTYATLHLSTQFVGKVRMELSPPVNHWWHVTLYVPGSGRGPLLHRHPKDHDARKGGGDGRSRAQLVTYGASTIAAPWPHRGNAERSACGVPHPANEVHGPARR